MPTRFNPPTARKSSVCSKVIFILPFMPLVTHADVKYPTKEQLQGIRDVCSGGTVHKIDGQLDAALEAWRLKPGAQGNLHLAIDDLAAIMEKIRDDRDGQLFKAYLDCVQNLIEQYLHDSSTPKSQTPTKPNT
jgi:hypothetical protein